ncbi:right-handed parallel beta-helix repeat-containing protein [Streptomyces sp. NPDC007851]|uniref:right-handed parallel beta-helix repeat-containing protein n=1 Tax=Streptomyces sp. NPDC007851 TaxID=3155008 RepID=UPI0033DE3D91
MRQSRPVRHSEYVRYGRLSGSAAAVAVLVTCATSGPAAAGDDPSTPVACSARALTTAVAAASPGETLSLSRDCTYRLTTPSGAGDGLPAVGRKLTIRGNGATIVRAGNPTATFRIFHVVSGGDLRLEDLTVRGGSAAGDGGGVLVDGGGKLTLSGVDVIDNTATNNGGGVAVSANATAVVRRGWLAFDNAAYGGGVYSRGTLSVQDTELSRNHARSAGGGLYLNAGDAFFYTSVIRRNTSAGRGGGVTDSGSAAVEFSDSKIANNTAAGDEGGGVQNLSSLRLERTEVSGNVVGGTAGAGGGVYNSTAGAVLVLRDSQVLSNSANGDGTSRAGGVFNDGGRVTLDHSQVRDNASRVAPGGVYTTTQFTVLDSTITRNTPTNCAGSPVIVHGCRD